MKALVVGGTGFIGKHIVKDLVSKGFQVKVLTREHSRHERLNHEQIEYEYGNVSDIESLKKCTRDVDLVYSAFGILGRWGIADQVYWDINSSGVENLLKSCLDYDIKQFIHISSAGVLGPLPDSVIADESFPINPSNPYEASKSDAERQLRIYGNRYGIPFTIIRPEFVYGPGDMHVLGLFKAIKAGHFILLGNGKSLLHPTYIDDLIQAIAFCTNNRNAFGETYLITGERPLTVEEVARTMAEEMEKSISNLSLPLPIARAAANVLEVAGKLFDFEPPLTISRVKFFTENRAFTNEKAYNELGYITQISFREGVKRSIRWYKDEGYL